MSVFFFVTFLLGYYIRYWTKIKKKKNQSVQHWLQC